MKCPKYVIYSLYDLRLSFILFLKVNAKFGCNHSLSEKNLNFNPFIFMYVFWFIVINCFYFILYYIVGFPTLPTFLYLIDFLPKQPDLPTGLHSSGHCIAKPMLVLLKESRFGSTLLKEINVMMCLFLKLKTLWITI